MNWWNAAILFALFAGHCELMAGWINRVHALPWPRTVLQGTRCVHDLLVVGFLPVVVGSVGLNGPRLLYEGAWSALPVGWGAYFVLCGVGCLMLAASSVRWLLRSEPERRSSRRVDIAEELGFVPHGPGIRGAIARSPFNEVFQLEVNEKEYTIPRLPRSLDGLTIAHLSDTHFRGPIACDYFRRAFEHIADMQADLVAFTGDLLDEPERVAWLPETFARLSAPLGCWFILGNHDCLVDPAPIRNAMTSIGWRDLSGRTSVVDHIGCRIEIGGDETPWMGEPPRFESRDAVDLRLLLSHTPDNLKRAAAQGVDMMLSGHNHGGQVCLPVIGPVYSPSRYGIRYAAGSFHCDATTLHVSRGISSERPLRWNCPPEVTRIVLRSV